SSKDAGNARTDRRVQRSGNSRQNTMFFESANLAIVRSVKQRDLLNTWLRLRGRTGMPSIAEYHPARLEEEMRELVYYVVRRDGDEFNFVIDSNGSTSAQAYGTSHNNNIGT